MTNINPYVDMDAARRIRDYHVVCDTKVNIEPVPEFTLNDLENILSIYDYLNISNEHVEKIRKFLIPPHDSVDFKIYDLKNIVNELKQKNIIDIDLFIKRLEEYIEHYEILIPKQN